MLRKTVAGTMLMLLMFTSLVLALNAQLANAAPPTADLDQLRNGAVGGPISPADWVNGNAGAQNAHYVEGYSISYRVRMTDLPTGTSITLQLGYDIKHSSKNAMDYLTRYDRMNIPSHQNVFGHPPETIDPLIGVTGVSGTVTYYTIPAPAGSPQPVTSYNNLLANEGPNSVKMTLFGGTITNIVYNTQGDLIAADAETSINVTFTVDSSTTVLAWGGHIASRADWGFTDGVPNSAGGISGSPYHMRLKGWSLNALGLQDRSLSAIAVYVPPPPAGCGRPVLTAPLLISADVAYIVGDTLNASFTIKNDGDAAIKLDKLCVGGRFNGGTLPNGLFPDFTFRTVTLQTGESHQYSGRLDLPEVGDYHFFIAYYIANPTEEEKKLLDPNNWNTCIDLAPGLDDNDRIWHAQTFDLPLATRASMLAKSMIGGDYNWGGNGWNWSKTGWGREHGCIFIGSQEMRSGQYYYYDKTTVSVIRGYGLDCSGLVYWAYNKAYIATTYAPKEGYEEVKTGTTTTGFVFPTNPVAFTNAHFQYKYNVQNMDKTTLKTDLLIGDLIFFDNPPADGWIDHVAMYVGDYFFAGKTIKSIYYPPGTYDCVEAYSPALGILPCVLETKEFAWTENGIVKTKTIPGLKDRGSFKSLEKPFGRVQLARLSLEEAKFFEIYPKSPITLKVTDPRGFTVSENVSEAPDMICLKYDVDEDGEPEDVVVVLNQIPGDYVIETIPKPDALPSDTYSLELSTNKSTITLAQNISISQTPPQPYIITSNGTAITPRLDPHDIGITHFVTSKTVVGQNFSLPSGLSIFNYGNDTEAFDVTVYANSTTIASFTNVTLASRNSTTLSILWDTTGFARGNYTVSAYVEPVPGETYTCDNLLSNVTVLVGVPCDVTGPTPSVPDGICNMRDIGYICSKFGTTPSSPDWDPNADVTGPTSRVPDNVVNMRDIGKACNNFMKS